MEPPRTPWPAVYHGPGIETPAYPINLGSSCILRSRSPRCSQIFSCDILMFSLSSLTHVADKKAMYCRLGPPADACKFREEKCKRKKKFGEERGRELEEIGWTAPRKYLRRRSRGWNKSWGGENGWLGASEFEENKVELNLARQKGRRNVW